MTAPDRVSGGLAWLLRVGALLTVLLLLAQPVTAGLFVTGEVGLLDLHAAGHPALLGAMLLQLVAAVLVWRPGHGPAWPIGASVLLLFGIQLQAGFGFVRLLSLHFPVGVLLFGAGVAVLLGTWSPRFRIRKATRAAGPGAVRLEQSPGQSPGQASGQAPG